MSGENADPHIDPDRLREPEEPVDPQEKPVPEVDPSAEEYVVADGDPEAPADDAVGTEDPDEFYPHAEDVEEDRA